MMTKTASEIIFEGMRHPASKFSIAELVLMIQRIAKILDEQHAPGQGGACKLGTFRCPVCKLDLPHAHDPLVRFVGDHRYSELCSACGSAKGAGKMNHAPFIGQPLCDDCGNEPPSYTVRAIRITLRRRIALELARGKSTEGQGRAPIAAPPSPVEEPLLSLNASEWLEAHAAERAGEAAPLVQVAGGHDAVEVAEYADRELTRDECWNAYLQMRAERDEALVQVESLTKDLVREQSGRSELFRSHGEALARIEKLEIERDTARNRCAEAVAQVEATRNQQIGEREVTREALAASEARVAQLEIWLSDITEPGCHLCGRDGDEAPCTEHLCDDCALGWRAERDAALKSAAEATERAERLEAELAAERLKDCLFPWEDSNGDEAGTGGLWSSNPELCRGCGGMLLPEYRRIADGCPCNSRRGINHGLVPKNTCTCFWCDPKGTGGTRYPADSIPGIERKRIAEPPAVATSERPIVVGSTWRDKGYLARTRKVFAFDRKGAPITEDITHPEDPDPYTWSDAQAFRDSHEWLSDPPVASKPESEET